MPKRRLKKQSRRLTTKKASKIAKKVREHKRKVRKAEKKNPVKASKHNAVLRDPGLPSQMPFKEKILHEAEIESIKRPKERDEKQKEWKKLHEYKNKAKAKSERADREIATILNEYKSSKKVKPKNDGVIGDDGSTEDPAKKEDIEKKKVKLQSQSQLKSFYKVVQQSDVVVEVLDARDPLGTRCRELEESVQESGAHKRLVLLINKIDLIPRDNLEKWLKYLRNEYPTIPFKSSTQLQRNNLKQARGKVLDMPDKLIKSKGSIGADALIQLLNNYSRSKNLLRKITVGIVGYPNTGKSSVINSLKRSRACRVGSVPGITKCQQLVYMDRHTWLLDSPGVVLSRDKSTLSAIINNCINIKELKCPERPVEAILKRCNKEQMMTRYMISDYSDVNEFLALLAKRLGFLKRNGIPNIDQAARAFLHDWNAGRIRYFTHPPKREMNEEFEKSEIVTNLSAPFNMNEIMQSEHENLDLIRKTKSVSVGIYSENVYTKKMEIRDDVLNRIEGEVPGAVSSEPVTNEVNTTDSDDRCVPMNNNSQTVTAISSEKDQELDHMECDGESARKNFVETSDWSVGNNSLAAKDLVIKVPELSSKASLNPSNKRKIDLEERLPGNQQLNKQMKKNFKKMKKEKKRTDAMSDSLSEAFESAFKKDQSNNDDYDFKVDFQLS